MSVQWIWLLCGGAAPLFYPLSRALSKRVRFRGVHQIDFIDDRKRAMRPWNLRILWLDFVRAWICGLVLRHAGEAAMAETRPAWLLISAVVLLATGWQMRLWRRDHLLLAPVGFVSGLTLALLPPQVAVVVILIGFVSLAAYRSLAFFFCVGAICTVCAGYLFLRINMAVALVTAMMLLPWMASWMGGRMLVIPMPPCPRKSRQRRRVVEVDRERIYARRHG